jgi:hypothetical protein
MIKMLVLLIVAILQLETVTITPLAVTMAMLALKTDAIRPRDVITGLFPVKKYLVRMQLVILLMDVPTRLLSVTTMMIVLLINATFVVELAIPPL